MKSTKKIIAALLLLMAMLTFVSCADDKNETPGVNGVDADNPVSQTVFLFSEPYPDSDTLARTVFDPAIELYRLFDGLGDLNQAWESAFALTVDGHEYNYFLVTDGRYPTFQSFVDDLRNHFSEEFVQDLLSREYYIERDGAFYASHGARGSNISFHDVNYEIISQTADKITFKATARYKDSALFELSEEEWYAINWDEMEFEAREFLYEYEKINDKWVFTTFRLFY